MNCRSLKLILALAALLSLFHNTLSAQKRRDTSAVSKHDTSKRIISLQKVDITGKSPRSYKSTSSSFGTKMQQALIDIPQSVSTVTKELIQDKMEFTLKDAADNVAGVSQYSGYDEYTIRGFRAENARDIDGLRGYNVTYTSPLLVNIERVEFIKGPTATLYGNCDPGGTINLVTKKPLSTMQTELNIYQGSWNHYRAEADVTGPLNAVKTMLFRLNAGYDNTNSFRDHVFSHTYQIAPSFSYIPNDRLQFNINLSVSHINTVLDRGQPGFDGDNNLLATPISLSLVQPGDYLRETDIATVASFTYKISNNLGFYSGFLNYRTTQDVAGHGVNSYINRDSVNLYYTTWHYPTVTNSINNYFTYVFKTGKVSHQLIAGYDFVRSIVNLNQQYLELPGQFGDGSGIVGTMSLSHPQYIARPVSQYQPSDFDNDASDVNDDVYHTQGVYMQDQLSLGRWKLLVGLREEFYKGDENDSIGDLRERVFLPRVGLVYALQPNVNWYATYNKGFDPFEASTGAQVFNEQFKPLISQLWETGIKGNFLNQKLYASLAVYQLTVQNVAVNANDLSNPNLFIQQGENRSRGLEAEIAGNIIPNLSVMLAYAYCVAKVTKSDVPSQIGSIVENAPLNSGSGWLKYTFSKGGLKGFGLSAGYTLASKRNTLDPGIVLPGYVIFNGGIRYGYKHWSLAMNVNNIANKTYWTGAYNNVYKWPGEPRNYMLNLGFRL
ncbi:MAG: TonB-dependent siderophore receptor [Mucilaginibacter sp.]